MMPSLSEDVFKLLLAVVVGGLIGLEREYSSKAAGFRSLILISIGSTLFTIISIHLGAGSNNDRIAANVITGIGFIGAGVVFKDGLTVTGITTASSIWATAALGMSIGMGDYTLAGFGLVIVMLVLSLFEYVQDFIDRIHQVRTYRICLDGIHDIDQELEQQLRSLQLQFERKRKVKVEGSQVYFIDVHGKRDRIDQFSASLMANSKVRSFDC